MLTKVQQTEQLLKSEIKVRQSETKNESKAGNGYLNVQTCRHGQQSYMSASMASV